MNWVFKSKGEIVDSKNENLIISFEQSGGFSGEKNEGALLFNQDKGKMEFTHVLEIESVDLVEIKTPEGLTRKRPRVKVTITLRLVQKFEEPRQLDFFTFSLKRINNYRAPKINFRRAYARLEKVEFDIIVQNRVYVKRTILGSTLNSLHRDHQKGVINYFAQEAPEVLFRSYTTDKALGLLREYFKSNILAPLENLLRAKDIWEQLSVSTAPISLRFGLEIEDDQIVELSIQNQIESVRFDSSPVIQLLLNPNPEFRNTPTEERLFSKLFQDRGLPITI
jgi:hypothetical protein